MMEDPPMELIVVPPFLKGKVLSKRVNELLEKGGVALVSFRGLYN